MDVNKLFYYIIILRKPESFPPKAHSRARGEADGEAAEWRPELSWHSVSTDATILSSTRSKANDKH